MRSENDLSRILMFGNSEDEGKNSTPEGWFIGHFVEGGDCLKNTNKVEVKWGHHSAGEAKLNPVANQQGRTLTLLVSGVFSIEFTDLSLFKELKRPGDYVIFAPGVMHRWKAIQEAVVVTVRWPSLPNDQK